MAKNLKAITNEAVGGRYVLADRVTGAVVDNNQGYGFKTPQKAYAANWYKNRAK